jgi:RNA polymerase-interacting CarD/CdnL/TRCF family regulator
MQLKIGDHIVHPVHGIGYITAIEEKRLSEKGTRPYYKISLSGRSIWIPVEAQATAGLRLVTDASELDQYRSLLESHPVPLNKNHHRRHRELVSRLKQGSFRVMCEVVRDLTAWSRRKPLGPTDMATLHKTREHLYQEWAIAAGIPIAEAIREVEFLLRADRPVVSH